MNGGRFQCRRRPPRRGAIQRSWPARSALRFGTLGFLPRVRNRSAQAAGVAEAQRSCNQHGRRRLVFAVRK